MAIRRESPQVSVSVENFQRLYDAAMGVVMIWDTEGTQNLAMPRLREALGLPGPRPTREEALERMDAWLGQLLNRGTRGKSESQS